MTKGGLNYYDKVDRDAMFCSAVVCFICNVFTTLTICKFVELHTPSFGLLVYQNLWQIFSLSRLFFTVRLKTTPLYVLCKGFWSTYQLSQHCSLLCGHGLIQVCVLRSN